MVIFKSKQKKLEGDLKIKLDYILLKGLMMEEVSLET